MRALQEPAILEFGIVVNVRVCNCNGLASNVYDGMGLPMKDHSLAG